MNKDSEKNDALKKDETLDDKSWVYRAFQIPASAIGVDGKIIVKPYAKTIHGNVPFIKILKRNVSPKVGDYARNLRSPVEKIVALMFGHGSAIVQLVERIQERDGETLRQAALSNWFIQPETPLSFMSRLFECLNNNQKVEDVFYEMLVPLIPNIAERLERDFPTRAPHIKEAFQLHSERRYISAIPLMLALSEGLALAKSGKSIFNTGRGKIKGMRPPKIAPWLDEQSLPQLARIYLSVLQVEHPLSQREKSGQLSRHSVLHGISVDYGTEKYALQAISILGFVGWAFCEDGLISPPL